MPYSAAESRRSHRQKQCVKNNKDADNSRRTKWDNVGLVKKNKYNIIGWRKERNIKTGTEKKTRGLSALISSLTIIIKLQ